MPQGSGTMLNYFHASLRVRMQPMQRPFRGTDFTRARDRARKMPEMREYRIQAPDLRVSRRRPGGSARKHPARLSRRTCFRPARRRTQSRPWPRSWLRTRPLARSRRLRLKQLSAKARDSNGGTRPLISLASSSLNAWPHLGVLCRTSCAPTRARPAI